VKQGTDCGSFAGTIGAKVTENLTTLDIKVNIDDTALLAVELG